MSERKERSPPDLLAAAQDALAILEAIELLDARRFGLKTETNTAVCNALHKAITKAERK